MSIKNAAAEAAQRQQEQIDAQHQRERQARPNAMHRAVVFLLRQASLNNRDSKREADHHIATLDNAMADKEALETVEAPSPANAAPLPVNDAPPPPAANTAAAAKKSRRFRSRTES